MRNHLLVSMFAGLAVAGSSLAAQQQKPSQEIAPIVAVEEQERDLAKAERLYREALAGTSLSAEARELATLRFAELLVRLGRRDEAQQVMATVGRGKGAVVSLDDVTGQGQDVAREAELRAKARELVQGILAQGGANERSPLPGVESQEAAEQLLWIGAAAVPEVAAALARAIESGERFPARDNAIAGLAAFLWIVGGEPAAAHLRELVRTAPPGFLGLLYRHAGRTKSTTMLALAAQFARDERDERLVAQLLGDNQLWSRVDPALLVNMAAARSAGARATVLSLLAQSQTSMPTELLSQLHGITRESLQSTDPAVGRAALAFLGSRVSQGSIEGVELLLQHLPSLHVNASLPSVFFMQRGRENDPTVIRRLWPQLLATARTLDPGSPHFGWLLDHMRHCALALDATIVPDLLPLLPALPHAPQSHGPVAMLYGKVTAANAEAVFAVFDRLTRFPDRATLLDAMLAVEELPAALFAPLAQRAAAWAEECRKQQEVRFADVFVTLMARTGHPDAASHIVAHWRADLQRGSAMARLLSRVAKRSPTEPVRAAMRAMAVDKDVGDSERSMLLLALLAMHDEQALDLVAGRFARSPAVRHPWATTADHSVSPRQYMLYANPDPPHGFSTEDVLRMLRSMLAQPWYPSWWDVREFSTDAIPDQVLGELVRLLAQHMNGTTDQAKTLRAWIDVVLRRRTGNPTGPLRDWITTQLAASRSVQVAMLESLAPQDVQEVQTRVEALLDSEHQSVAETALWALERAEIPLDPERHRANRNAEVRQCLAASIGDRRIAGHGDLLRAFLRDPVADVRKQAAQGCGALVDKEAVPGLIDLLRDGNESVRTAAADALQRIRFFHEQQAHWDRVLKGLDASPATAAEKLLLQGKPGAPTEQRLLAIRSLGALGMPEALPFLIEWTQDGDAAIAAAAKAAITEIHLHPRR
jgi:hypothetical protein